MAPEILEGEKYNQECDLWSLGIIIYVLYFKQYPYNAETAVAILMCIKKLGNKIIKKTGNKDLDDLIIKLIEKDPKKRITWKDYFDHQFLKKIVMIFQKIKRIMKKLLIKKKMKK